MLLVTTLKSGQKKHSSDHFKTIHFLFKNIHFGRHTTFPPNIKKDKNNKIDNNNNSDDNESNDDNNNNNNNKNNSNNNNNNSNNHPQYRQRQLRQQRQKQTEDMQRNYDYSPIRPLFLVGEHVLILEGPKGKFTVLAVITRITEKRIYVQKQDNAITWIAEANIRRI
jgi:hypothetical protein